MNIPLLVSYLDENNEPIDAYIAGAYLMLCAGEKRGWQGLRLTDLIQHSAELVDDKAIAAFVVRSLENYENLTWMETDLPKEEGSLRELLAALCESSKTTVPRDLFTPSMASLLIKSLGGLDGDPFIDLHCGVGSLIFEYKNQHPNSAVFGAETDEDSAAIAQIRAKAAKVPASIRHESPQVGYGANPLGCNAVLAVTPELRKLGVGARSIKMSPWRYCETIAQALGTDRRALVIVPRSSTNTKSEAAAREKLVSTGAVEAVIQLPERAMKTIAAPVVVVLSVDNHASVRMVDASALGRKDHIWGVTALSEGEVEEVIEWLHADGTLDGKAADVEISEVAKHKHCLEPARYLTTSDDVANGKQLQKLARISRGTARLSKAALSKPGEPSPYRYLEVKSIVDNEIDYENLPFLNPECENEYDPRYVVEQGDIVLSKVGPNYKVAIVEPPYYERIIASGNLYVIRANEMLIDAYYIRSFFDTELSWKQLTSSAAGSGRMQSIPVGALKEMLVPYLSDEARSEIAEEYKARRKRIKECRRVIAEEQEALKKLFG